MRRTRILLLIGFALIAVGHFSTPLARADEVSAEQEKKRAEWRAAYLKAKQAEKQAFERRRAALDRMNALLAAGNQDLASVQRLGKEISNKVTEKRQDLKRAERALDIALGSHGRDVSDPAVVAAQARLDAAAAEVARLEKALAANQEAEKSRIELPAGHQVHADLLRANLEADRSSQNAVEALAIYLAALRPDPPPHLQSVTIFAGTRRMYHAEWRVDDKAADSASAEQTQRLERMARDIQRVIGEIQEVRDDLTKQREALIEPMIKYDGEINLAAVDIDFYGWSVVIVPAIIEGVGVIAEVALTGGASTAERYTIEKAIESGTSLAGGLAKRSAGQALTATEKEAVAAFETYADAALSKGGAAATMQARVNKLIEDIGLRPGSTEAIKIVVSDAAEQLIVRTLKAAAAAPPVGDLARMTVEELAKWKAAREGAFFGSKATLDGMKDAFKGSRSANVLGLGVTAAKAIAAAYFGHQLGKAEERFAENLAMSTATHAGYDVLLQADRKLWDKQRELADLYLQALAYRLLFAGPRALKVVIDEGNEDASETLTVRLHVSQPIGAQPSVSIAGKTIDMKAQDKSTAGSSYWEGELAMKALPEDLDSAVLEVALGRGSKPYADLDSNPATAVRFVVPDDLTQTLPNRDEWTDYERGPDRHHRIALRNAIDPCLVGIWVARDVAQFAGFEVTFRKNGTQVVDYTKSQPMTFGSKESITWGGVGTSVISTKDKTATIKEKRQGSVTMTLARPGMPDPAVWKFGDLMGLAGLGGTTGDNKYACSEDALTYQGSTHRDRRANYEVKLRRRKE